MSVRALSKIAYIPHRLGAESVRRWASMNLDIMLNLALQVHCEADHLIEFLVGSPEFGKFRRTDGSLGADSLVPPGEHSAGCIEIRGIHTRKRKAKAKDGSSRPFFRSQLELCGEARSKGKES